MFNMRARTDHSQRSVIFIIPFNLQCTITIDQPLYADFYLFSSSIFIFQYYIYYFIYIFITQPYLLLNNEKINKYGFMNNDIYDIN